MADAAEILFPLRFIPDQLLAQINAFQADAAVNAQNQLFNLLAPLAAKQAPAIVALIPNSRHVCPL